MGLQREHLEGNDRQDAWCEIHQESRGKRQEEDQERRVGGHTEPQAQEIECLPFIRLGGFAAKTARTSEASGAMGPRRVMGVAEGGHTPMRGMPPPPSSSFSASPSRIFRREIYFHGHHVVPRQGTEHGFGSQHDAFVDLAVGAPIGRELHQHCFCLDCVRFGMLLVGI